MSRQITPDNLTTHAACHTPLDFQPVPLADPREIKRKKHDILFGSVIKSFYLYIIN